VFRITAILALLLCLAAFASPQRARAHQRRITLESTADSGVIAYLSDHSAWEIRTENRAKISQWPKGEPVGVFKITDPDFPYRLVLRPNEANGEIVAAKPLHRVR
jgi:hypothetical protein